jgi:drug/metabolite transporter (DMT)-like permease
MTSIAQNHTLRAGLLMIGSTACFVIGDTCIKLLGSSLPVGQIICLVGLFSSVFLVIISAQQGILNCVAKIFTGRVLLRSFLDMVGSFMFVAALMHMPIADMATIMQTIPLVVVVVAMIFLGERAGISRIVAVVVGFIGVLLIVKPAPQSVSIYQFLALGTVFVVALRDIVTKRIGPEVPLLMIALANAVFLTLSGFGFGFMQGFQPVDTWRLEVLVGAGLFVTLGYIFILATVRLGELSATAPFRYSEVVFAIIAGILVFSEYPDFWSYFGMALVIAAGLYAAHNESIQARDAKEVLMPPAF